MGPHTAWLVSCKRGNWGGDRHAGDDNVRRHRDRQPRTHQELFSPPGKGPALTTPCSRATSLRNGGGAPKSVVCATRPGSSVMGGLGGQYERTAWDSRTRRALPQGRVQGTVGRKGGDVCRGKGTQGARPRGAVCLSVALGLFSLPPPGNRRPGCVRSPELRAAHRRAVSCAGRLGAARLPWCRFPRV